MVESVKSALGQILSLILCALFAVPSTSCQTPLPAAPMLPGPEFSAPQEVVPEGLAEDPAVPFVLLPGDSIHLVLDSVEPVDLPALVVDSTGSVSIPLIEPVEVSGLSLDEAATAVQDAMRRFDRFARARITLTAADGHRATVVGAVGTPGVFVLTPGTRVADLVAQAGGLPMGTNETGLELFNQADPEAARLVRGGDAVPLSLTMALKGASRHNVRVQPGDLLYVPPMRNSLITVLGYVNEQGRVPFAPGLRLTQALAEAGGTTPDADNGDIHVVRGPLSKPQVYRASLRALILGNATDVVLQRGDIVYVTQDAFYAVTDVLARLAPLLTAGAIAETLIRSN